MLPHRCYQSQYKRGTLFNKIFVILQGCVTLVHWLLFTHTPCRNRKSLSVIIALLKLLSPSTILKLNFMATLNKNHQLCLDELRRWMYLDITIRDIAKNVKVFLNKGLKHNATARLWRIGSHRKRSYFHSQATSFACTLYQQRQQQTHPL